MELEFRFATIRELPIYFRWINDHVVRLYSFNSNPVSFENHVSWFKKRLLSEDCYLYFFSSNEEPVGQVRIEKSDEETVIGISIDEQFRGRSLSWELLVKATSDFLKSNPGLKITAYIKTDNLASYKSFIKAGFSGSEIILIKNIKSYKLIKQ